MYACFIGKVERCGKITALLDHPRTMNINLYESKRIIEHLLPCNNALLEAMHLDFAVNLNDGHTEIVTLLKKHEEYLRTKKDQKDKKLALSSSSVCNIKRPKIDK